MKKDCEYTRRSLKNYLRGHLFRLQKMRIDRHLSSCVVCRSEFEALKRAEETKLFMRDLAQTEGVVSRAKEGFAALARIKKIFYRPLWIAGIAGIAFVVYSYVVTPRQVDLELESIVKTAPVNTSPVPTVALSTAPVSTTPSATAPVAIAPPPASKPAAPKADALTITITLPQENAKTAMRQLNDVMRGHGKLRKKRFSDEVRELSDSLTAKELLTLFKRIEEIGKVSYSRRRFDSFPSAQEIPFTLKLQEAPAVKAQPAAASKPSDRPGEAAAPSAPPAPPATAPTPSSAH